MIFYTADLHFGHNNVIRFDDRPFADSEEMDRVLIELWNARVRPDDTVYIVGDLCYRSAHPADWYLRQLKGHKILINGNHDGHILNDPQALALLDDVRQMLEISDGDKRVFMCHYPVAEWPGYYKGVYHVYGHIHNKRSETFDLMKTRPLALNAGCMINNYAPVSLKELIRNIRTMMLVQTDIYRSIADQGEIPGILSVE